MTCTFTSFNLEIIAIFYLIFNHIILIISFFAQGKLADAKTNLGKDDMLGMIRHGANFVFANKVSHLFILTKSRMIMLRILDLAALLHKRNKKSQVI